MHSDSSCSLEIRMWSKGPHQWFGLFQQVEGSMLAFTAEEQIRTNSLADTKHCLNFSVKKISFFFRTVFFLEINLPVVSCLYYSYISLM